MGMSPTIICGIFSISFRKQRALKRGVRSCRTGWRRARTDIHLTTGRNLRIRCVKWSKADSSGAPNYKLSISLKVHRLRTREKLEQALAHIHLQQFFAI